jgi:FKBP-type peptidyl-prolyl cis-trans isomerase
MPVRGRGMQVKDLKKGRGAVARPGLAVTVHYRGVLQNGKEFDSSWSRRTPFTFTLGAGEVIKGWDQGVVGMRVGGRRRLVIPPNLGYGPGGTPDGSIPRNATLIFVVDLLKVERR